LLEASHEQKTVSLGALMGARDSIGQGLDALIGQASAHETAGDWVSACRVYEDWLARESADRQPMRHLVLFNLGAMLQAAGALDRAQAAYSEALSLSPYFAQALINQGLVLEKLGQTEEAIATWAKAAQCRYSDEGVAISLITSALNHIGRLREQQKRYDLAHAALEESLRLDPKQPAVIQHWFHIRQKACIWPVDANLPGISPNERLTSTSPLAMLAHSDEPAEQYIVNKAFVNRLYPMQPGAMHLGGIRSHKARIRLGYLSGDLCTHAVGLLLPELLRSHNKEKFEVFVYDYTADDGSGHQDQLRQIPERRIDVRPLTDEQIAQRILEDEIDVLIDLHGLSSGARPGVLARRPCALQGTYLGFIGSSAMPWLDFVVADNELVSDSMRPFMTEDVLAVEGSFLPWALAVTSQIEPAQKAITRAELGLPEGKTVFAALGNSYKINPRLFSSWMRILSKAPDAVLWLVDDNPAATKNLRQQAQRMGIAPNRLIFTGRIAHAIYRQALGLADVFLDTYPYNCGSTAVDVVAAGPPLITLRGKTMVSRMGASLLKGSGAAGQVTDSFEAYERAALEWANAVNANANQPRTFMQGTAVSTEQMVASMERQLIDRLKKLGYAGAFDAPFCVRSNQS